MTKKSQKDQVDDSKTEKLDSNKKQALDLALSQITKQFGDGSIMKLGETPKMDVELLPSDTNIFFASLSEIMFFISS